MAGCGSTSPGFCAAHADKKHATSQTADDKYRTAVELDCDHGWRVFALLGRDGAAGRDCGRGC